MAAVPAEWANATRTISIGIALEFQRDEFAGDRATQAAPKTFALPVPDTTASVRQSDFLVAWLAG